MRRFYAPKDSFSDQSVVLDTGETRHLSDVLRLSRGETVSVFNGLGQEFLCEIESVEKKKAFLRIIQEIQPAASESHLYVTLAMALTKGEKFDLVVQKAVELGVRQLIPLFTRRCDVKPSASGKRLERWQKIALEAAKQSGRARLMSISEPMDFPKFAKSARQDPKQYGTVVLFSERDGESFSAFNPDDKITAVVGPEGGWDDSELDLAKESGFVVVTLGGRILRAETAAIAITAILQHRFGDVK